jgi:hypothetical protein
MVHELTRNDARNFRCGLVDRSLLALLKSSVFSALTRESNRTKVPP